MKKILSLLLAFVFVIGICASAPITANAASVNDLTFKLIETDIEYYRVETCSTSAAGKLVIPSTYNGLPVKAIANSAFSGCSSLRSITIPDSITNIDRYAFSDCSSLESVIIPDSVTSISGYAFRGCTSLTNITIPSSVTSIFECAFYGCSSLTNITIPDSVTSIGTDAFTKCTSLESIAIPDSVTSISWSAFSGCTGLKKVVLPNSITTINNHVFMNCTSLENITIPDSVTRIEDSVFRGCSSLKNVIIPNSVTNIGYYAFENCTSLKNLKIPVSVTRIADYAFSGCTSLVSIIIPDGTTRIYGNSFKDCTSLESVIIPDSVTIIDDSAFYGCTSLEKITIPDGVTTIGESVFNKCTSLESVTIPDGVTSIENYAFRGCTSLKSVTIPDSVTSIGKYAFSDCLSLESITIPNSVTNIGIYAFGYKYDSQEKNTVKVESFTIFGQKGSKAEEYATENGIDFSDGTKPHEHNYISEITKETTCTSSGEKTFTCSCGDSYTETVSALGHDYSSEYTIDRVPSYQQAGEQSRHCSRCDERTDITVLPKLESFDPPVITKAVSEKTGIRLTWNPVDGVEGYMVFKLVNGAYRSIATLNPNQTTYLDTEVDDGGTYCYALASTNYIGDAGDYSEIAVTYKKIVSLSTPTATTKNTAQGIKITWGAVENAEKYVVYQRVYNKSTKKYSGWKAIKTTTDTSYVDTSVKIGVGYSYAVRAVNGSVKSSYKATKGLTYNVTPTVKIANASTGVKVTWTKAANATGYTVYRSQYNTKTKKWSSWKNMGTAKANKTSWVDRSAKSGVTYKYTVRACNGSVKSKYKASANVLYLAQPKTTVKAISTGVNVSWTQCSGAKGYTVYRSELVDGKWTSWKNMGTAKSNQKSWVDKSAQSGATYRYTVRAVNGNYKSSYTASGSVAK